MIQDLVAQRRAALAGVVSDGLEAMLHTDAWHLRVLPPNDASALLSPARRSALEMTDDVSYAGLPRVAALGYLLGSTNTTPPSVLAHSFVEGLTRLRQRQSQGQMLLASDDIALLGIADGMLRISELGGDITEARSWITGLVNEPTPERWSGRMRALAGDMLDQRGRLHLLPPQGNTDSLALELALRATWPLVFRTIPLPRHDPAELLRALLVDPLPDDPERGSAWLRCIDVLINTASHALTHSTSDTVRILRSVQHAFKRWPYEDEPRRRGIAPIRWIIDNEYNVQSLLWAILYPIYKEALVDEVYLEDWGNKRPRIDLGITSLKLIIEVKLARSQRDFTEIEEQVAGDVGLYFKDRTRFDRMIVFVYDDCDEHHPERYDGLRDALMKRPEIEEVVIVRRPGKLPNQKMR